ncbi:MAG: hypothetical protein IPQ16_12375 [Geobacteraceae bacterium]|nr:hypothetical protein [Geobacteraceae bacterium]
MRQLFVGLVVILFTAKVSHAFELDGLNSGISMERARKILEGSSYQNIQTRDNGIIATGANRFILLNFCKDGLVLAQKHLAPGFDNFVRLIEEKRRELGKPADAWAEPADVQLPVERNAVAFLWRDGLTSVKVTYTEFASNKQLDVLYEIKNECRQILN